MPPSKKIKTDGISELFNDIGGEDFQEDNITGVDNSEPQFYKLTMRMDGKYKKLISDGAYYARKSIVQYISDLVDRDVERRGL